jgi:hypothetical protein
MAATSEREPHGGTETALSRKLGPLPVWGWAAIGIALALFFGNKKKKGAGSTDPSQTGSPFGYSLASQQQAAGLAQQYGAAYPIGYSDYSSGQDLAGVLSQLSTQISALGAGNSGTNKSPAPTPGSTQTGAANQTNPAPTPNNEQYVPFQGDLVSLNRTFSTGVPVYQLGQEGIDWALRTGGGNPMGIDPAGHYQLSQPAADALLQSGQKVYVRTS